MSLPGAALVAHTRRIADDVDLLHVAGPEGFALVQEGNGLAGRGTALRIPLEHGPGRLAAAADQVAVALGAIERHDEVGLPGCGPVAFAALPFAEARPASAVVPALVVGRAADGTRWSTSVGPPGAPVPALVAGPSASTTSPTAFEVHASRPSEQWCDAVARAVAAMQAGRLVKVVLAREVVVETDRPVVAGEVAGRLRAATPSALVYCVDGLVGASPELLVSRSGDVVRSQPMAGTAPRSGDPNVDTRLAASLLASTKDRAEHQITIDMVLDTVLPFCSYVDSEPVPQVVPAGAVQHLASLVEGRLSSPPASVLSLVAALHPTPAVCGWPRAEALALIEELEELDRGRYTGAVGWVDADGNGRFAVAIRGVELDGCRARVLAGNGIVADSDPATELAETRSKLQTVLSALIRP
ncbi:MAG: isochorismate synthase [Actinobacteria bacterium]|nr:isochorismate synthase [Actinomycetota bacterium]MBW3641866.1 isochorismate synthase [Actinomycetota bacterium]